MMLSKMHYARVLAEKGHKVYFVNPPRENAFKKSVQAEEKEIFPGLRVIHLKPIPNALFLRHKLLFVYNLLIQKYIIRIKQVVTGKIDEVWNFNPHTFTDVRKFDAVKNILLLYDFYKGAHVHKAATAADVIVSPSRVILDHYQNNSVPELLIQHGLGQHFSEIAKRKMAQNNFSAVGAGKIKIGYMGNLLREGMDTEAAQKIIEAHPDKEFHFWGPVSVTENNVTDVQSIISPALTDFISFLERCSYVFLHGLKGQAELAEEINGMDAFLFLYTPSRDINGASNSHKLLEYLSTGKIVISSQVSNYAGTGLLAMCENGQHLTELFTEVINNLPAYNSAENQMRRISFALDNTYIKQVERIEKFLYETN